MDARNPEKKKKAPITAFLIALSSMLFVMCLGLGYLYISNEHMLDVIGMQHAQELNKNKEVVIALREKITFKDAKIKDLEEQSVFLLALDPLADLVSDDDIKGLITDIPRGNPFKAKHQITASFGESTGFAPRINHKGTDMIPRNPETADWSITAFAPGEVVSFGVDYIYGKYITIEHSPRIRTKYCHLSKIYYTGTTGELVTADTRIGVMGDTGRATAAHLHFEIQIRVNVDTWIPVDAKPFLINEAARYE